MTFQRTLLTLTAIALGLGAATQVQAAIVVVAPTATTAGSLTITQDITMVVTSAGSASFLVMDEWVTSDGAFSGSPLSQAFVFSLNGASDKSEISAVFDNAATPFGGITANDGLLRFSPAGSGNELAVGNTFTLRAGTHALGASSGFNPQATQTFTGDVFLAGSGGIRMSANTPAGPVPEPGTTLLGALAGLTLLRRRR